MTLFRAIFLELVNPFLATLVVMAGLLMTEKVYRLVNLVVDRRLNMGEVGLMLVYLLPQVLTVTLPMAIVGAVFVTVIRQSIDSEVITLRATGRALWNYAVPFLWFGVLVTLLTAFVTLWLQPVASRKYGELQVEMVRWRAEQKLVPGELNYDFGDKVIRIGGRRSERELADIFIANRQLGANSTVIAAETGWIEVDEQARQVVFRLQNGTVYTLDDRNPDFRTVDFQTLRYALEYQPAQTVDVRTIRTVPTQDMAAEFWRPRLPAPQHRAWEQELFRRLATPVACLAFALASIPMAIVDPRSGRGGGYLRAIFLVTGYFVVWAAFKDLVGGGKAAAYTLFVPAALIFLFGLIRLWQINADIDSLWRAFRR